MFPKDEVRLKEGAHIGHGAMIHGATIGVQAMVGMNAVVLDHAEIGDGCIVGALALVKARSKWEGRSLIVGNPAQKVGDVSDEMFAHKVEGTALYQQLPQDMQLYAKKVSALDTDPGNRIEDFPILRRGSSAARKNPEAWAGPAGERWSSSNLKYTMQTAP